MDRPDEPPSRTREVAKGRASLPSLPAARGPGPNQGVRESSRSRAPSSRATRTASAGSRHATLAWRSRADMSPAAPLSAAPTTVRLQPGAG